MANGIPSLNPFPQFGGQQSPGVTPVKLAPAAVRFPTARRQAPRRSVEPTTKEKLAPLAPFLVGGIMDMFQGKPETLTDEQYLQNLGADPENITDVEQASLDAYKLFGPRAEANTFGLDEIANIVASSQMGRGAKDYASTYMAMRKADATKNAQTETTRAAFIKNQLDNGTAAFLNLQDSEAARTGVVDIRPGFVQSKGPQAGVAFINDPEHPDADENGFRPAGPNWVDPSKLDSGKGSAIDIFKNPNYTALTKTNAALSARDQAVTSMLNVSNSTIEMLQEGIKDPTKAGTTTVAALANVANSALVNFDVIATAVGGDAGIDGYFSTSNSGGSTILGTGDNAKKLYNAIKSGDEDQINQATADFENATGTDIRQILGETAYANVATRANFLQLAYMAAAANGQTGRTLSDKDLAYHLQIVGFGSTQDPKVLNDNLLRFGDQLVRGLDAETQVALPINGMSRYNMMDPEFQSVVSMYYNPMVKPNAEGKDTAQWLDYGTYTYKPFYQRYGSIPQVQQWQQHKGIYFDRKNQKTAVRPGDPIDVNKEYSFEIQKIRDLTQ
jgi:hypothetical protein